LVLNLHEYDPPSRPPGQNPEISQDNKNSLKKSEQKMIKQSEEKKESENSIVCIW